MPSLLDQLRERSAVSAHALTADVPAVLGPFEDAISEIEGTEWQVSNVEALHDLIKQSAKEANKWASKFPDIKVETLAAEILAIRVLHSVSHQVKGNFHIPTNPFQAYSTERSVKNAHRLLYLCGKIGLDKERVCIRIFATAQGFQACKELSEQGIMTAAIGVTAKQQVARAAQVGCTYISPRLHYFDEANQIEARTTYRLCSYAQQYYKKYGHDTKILPEGNMAINGALSLAGSENIAAKAECLQLLATSNEDITKSPYLGIYSNYPEPGGVEEFKFTDDGDYEAQVATEPGNPEFHTREVSCCQTRAFFFLYINNSVEVYGRVLTYFFS